MNETDLCYTPATELVHAIRAKQLSAVEVTTAVLNRIARLDVQAQRLRLPGGGGSDGGGTSRRPGAGLGRAARSAARRAGDDQGSRGGARHAGRVRHASAQRATSPRPTTPMVARLRAAGAIILGKTTTPEFGWMGVSNSPLTGITHNPWKHGMNAGASSAGAGVGARRRLRAVAPGQRRRRLDPHAGAFLRRLRPEADLRPRAAVAGRRRATTRCISAR